MKKDLEKVAHCQKRQGTLLAFVSPCDLFLKRLLMLQRIEQKWTLRCEAEEEN